MRGVITNEELATRIKAGERELLPQLWGQCKKVITLLAIKYRGVMERHAFVDMDDFIQCGYFALLNAVNVYDPAKRFKFSSYLNFSYKRQIYSMFGNVREGDKRIFPLPATSLNVMIENDGHETELLEMLEDENSSRFTEDYERNELREIVAAAVNELPERERFVIRQLYFCEKTKTQLVDGRIFNDQFHVARIENTALRLLRRNKALRALYYTHFPAPPSSPDVAKADPAAAAMEVETWDEWIGNLTRELEVRGNEFSANAGTGD